jgi:hypothetical protein
LLHLFGKKKYYKLSLGLLVCEICVNNL